MPPASLHVGPLLLPASGLAAAAGVIAAMLLARRTAPRAGVAPDLLWDTGIFAVVTAFAASRLLLVAGDLRSFVRAPLLVLTLPSLTAAGGLVTLLATGIYLRRRGIPWRRVLDAAAAPAAMLWAVLGLGHLLEGTDPGMPTRQPWGVSAAPGEPPQHPIGLYAACAGALLAGVLWQTLEDRHTPGTIGALGLIAAGGTQFLLSFLREPLLPEYTPTPLLEPLEWLALGMVLAGATVLLGRARRAHPRGRGNGAAHAL